MKRKIVDTAFGNRLRQLRHESGVTQKELAEAFNKSRVAITRWEMGHTHPDIYEFIKLSDFLHVDPHYLLGMEARVTK